MVNITSFFNSLLGVGFLDSVQHTDNSISLTSGKESLEIKISPMGTLFWSDKTGAKVVSGLDVGKATARLATQFFSQGTAKFRGKVYSNVVVYPDKVQDGRVIFSDFRGKKWITSTANETNITLAFYDILAMGKNEHAVLALPGLEPLDSVKVETVTSSVDAFFMGDGREWLSPLVSSLELVPNDGYRTYFDRVLSSKDKVALSWQGAVIDSFYGRQSPYASSISSSATADKGARWMNDVDDVTLKLRGSEILFSAKRPEVGGFRASSYVCKGDMARITELLSSVGVVFSDLQRGVTLDGKTAQDVTSALRATVRSLFPVPVKGLAKIPSTRVYSGKKAGELLKGWGVQDTAGAIKKVTVVKF